jgi:DNA-binding transcriptional ArsR family regulator
MIDDLIDLSDMRSRNVELTETVRPLSEIKADLFKALAHPARIRALEVLSTGEHSVSDLVPEVGIESSHLSQQLAVLRRAGLVTTRKEGATVFYALKSPLVRRLLATAKDLLLEQLAETRDLLDGLQAERRAR